MTNHAYPCPCCGYLTLPTPETDSYEICEVCFWEENEDQADDPDDADGPNHVSLNEARANFAAFGACERRLLEYVRAPRPEEIPRAT
jgi:hypothetical protein